MYVKNKRFKKDERIHNWKEVTKRRMDYITFLLKKDIPYDFEQQAVKEYQNCQKQRSYTNPVELRKISRKVTSENSCIISRIAVSVTNQCSLKCRDCNNLMPYCKERFIIGVDEQIQDIKKILTYADEIINVEIIGGEPFVYKQLPKLLEYVCKETRIRFVEITTNGTILPCREVIDLLTNPKICVLISDYGEVNTERSKKTYEYLLQNHVCVRYLNNTKWIMPGGIENRNKSRIKMKYEYFHCFARKDCRTLYKGKLYVCGRAPILDELGLLTDKSCYLDIRNMMIKKMVGKRKLQRFYQNSYAECCNYCDCASDKACWIKAGVQK